MRKLTIAFLLLFLSMKTYSQLNISGGLSAGYQVRDQYIFDTQGLTVSEGTYASIGYGLQLYKMFYLQNEFGFIQTGMKYKTPDYSEIFNYMHYSVFFKVKPDFSALYFSIGLYASYLTSAAKVENTTVNDITRLFLPYDYGYVPALGIKFNLGYFEIFSEARIYYGYPSIYQQNEIRNRTAVMVLGINFLKLR